MKISKYILWPNRGGGPGVGAVGGEKKKGKKRHYANKLV